MSSQISKERKRIVESSLEEAIRLAFRKRIEWGRFIDVEWYRTAERYNLLVVPEASDIRVQRIAAILQALRYDNITKYRGFGMPSESNRVDPVYFEHNMDHRRIALQYRSVTPPEDRSMQGLARFEEFIRDWVFQVMALHPSGRESNRERLSAIGTVKDHIVGRPGTAMKPIDHTALQDGSWDHVGLVHVMAFLYEVLPAMPWTRHPYLMRQPSALVELGLYKPGRQLIRSEREASIERGDHRPSFSEFVYHNQNRLGLTSIQVLQYALTFHFGLDVSRGDNPFWVTALIIIADGYIRATLTPWERDILLDFNPGFASQHRSYQVVPEVLRHIRVPAYHIVQYASGERRYYDPTGVVGYYHKLTTRMRHEMMALRKRDPPRIIAAPPENFLYPLGDLDEFRQNRLQLAIPPSGAPGSVGVLDPTLMIRDLLALSIAGMSTVGSQQSVSVLMRTYKNRWSLMGAVGKRILVAEEETTIDILDIPALVQQRWMRDPRYRGLRSRAWHIAAVLMVLSLRTLGDTSDNRLLASLDYDRKVAAFRENVMKPASRTSYPPYYDIYQVLYNTRQNLGSSPWFWGPVAYIAMFIYDTEADAGTRLTQENLEDFDRTVSRLYLME